MYQIELRSAIYTASIYKKGPIVIRYPRGEAGEEFTDSPLVKLEIGSSVVLSERCQKTALISIGTIGIRCQEIAEELNISHYDLRFVKPLDASLLKKVFERINNFSDTTIEYLYSRINSCLLSTELVERLGIYLKTII